MIEIKAPNGQIIEIEGSTIPTEAELDEIFKATGTNGKPLTKSVMDASDGQIYNAPIGMDATDINFNIQTQHKGLNKADFFGKVATSLNPINAIDNVKDTYNQISKALETGDLTKEDIKDAFVKSSVQLAQNVTKPVSKVAEFVTESNTSKAVAKSVVDVAGSFSNAALDTLTGFQDLEVAKETGIAPDSLIAGARVRFDAIVNGTDYKTSVNKLLESTKKLKDKNKKFFEDASKNILPNEEMDKLDQLVYGVSNGLTSIGAAVGMALMTKNPTAGSAIVAASFGKMQQSEYYDKSREAGYSAERSQFYGNIAGIANAGLEFVGNKILLGLGGVKPIKAINENVIKTTIAKLGKNEATKGAAAKIISKHLNSVGKQGLKAFGSEFGEEFLQEGFEAALEKATGVSDLSWSEVLNNAIYSGFIGGLSGGIFGSASTAITNNQIKAHNEKIKGFIKATQSDLTEEELQVTADVVQEMLFQEASNYQDQVSKHIEKELDIDVAPEGLTKESLLKQTRDSLKSKFGMTDEEIDKYCDSALTAIDARNQYNEVFTSFRDALIGIGVDSNKAGATAQLLSARALSAAIDSKTTAQDIVKRFKLKFERENFNKDNFKSVLEDDYIPFQTGLEEIDNSQLYKKLPQDLKDAVDFIYNAEPVYDITGQEFPDDGTNLNERVFNYYKEVCDNHVYLEGFGDIALDERSIKTSIIHGISNNKVNAFAAVPSILREGKLVKTQEQYEGKPENRYLFVAPITVANKKGEKQPYYAEVVVKEGTSSDGTIKGKKRFYIHEVELTKKLTDSFTSGVDSAAVVSSKSIISKLIKNVNSKVQFQEGEERNLVAVHSISASNLEKAIDLGGFPVSSIAIINKEQEFHFDEQPITLVGNKEMIDPKNKKNEVYNRDIWSITFPTEEYKVPKQSSIDKFRKKYAPYFNKVLDSSAMSSLLYTVGFNPRSAMNEFSNSLGAKLYYVENVLKENFDVPLKDRSLEQLKFDFIDADETFVNDLKDIDINFEWNDEVKSQMTKAVKDALERTDFSKYGKHAERMKKAAQETLFDDDGVLNWHIANNMVKKVHTYLKMKGKLTADYYEIRDLLNDKIKDKNAYEKWATDEFRENLIGEPLVEVGKKLLPRTLDNITKAMVNNATVNGQNALVYGSGKVIAAGAKKLNSIKEIKTEGKKLVSQEEQREVIKQLEEDMSDFTNQFMTASDFSSSMNQKEAAYRALGTIAAKETPTTSDLQKILNYELDNKKVYSKEILEAGVKIANSVKNLSRYYFEAKPQRAVTLQEFSGAIIPTSSEFDAIASKVESNGLKVIRSDNQIEAIRQLDNVYFQGEQSAPRGAYDVTQHIIKLFETVDTSTLIHELGHFFLEDLKDYANDVNSINMLEEVYRYLGVKDGVITSEQHELFADSFEKYVLNGKAPNSTLAKCFQAFARWLRNLKYEIQRLGYVKLSDDITKTFDKMLGGKALDFAMQNSSLQLQEQLDSGNLPRYVVDRAIKMLEDGIISRADMDDIVAKLRTGELKKKEVASELKRLEGLNVKHHEALNPFDTMKYRQQLSAGNFDKAKVIAKIERLVDWTKPRTSGGKEVGRFPNKQLNDLFDNVRNILAMSKEDARAKIRENLDKLGDAFTTQSALDDGETREALIFENKLLSIPAKRTSAQNLIDVYNALSESYNLGRLSDSLTKRAKKERREGMIKTALQTISGDVNPSIEQSKISQFLNKLGSSQYAWQGLLDILSMNDKTSKTGKSALNKMLDVFEAEQQEARGVADDGEIFSEIAARKFASNNNHKIALSRYVDKELSKESILTWGKYRKKFTKDQLIDIYMKSLDPETREIMINDEINGFNEEFLSLVKQELTSDDLAFADALFEFYKQNYDKINPYYEERFGVSLGKRDYYSPRSMERTGTNLDTGDIISFAGFGNIKKRTVKNKGTIKVKGAFKTFNEYVVNSNHYLAWSEKLIDINAVFGNVEIKNAISNIFGKSMLNRIDYEISRFASNDTFQKKFSLGVNFNKLRSNYAKSVLGLKPSLAIKQLTSFPAYLENMSSVEFMTGVTDFFKHPKEAMELLGNTTLMKTRDVNIIKDFAELSKLDILKGKGGKKFSDLMMLNIKLGDRGAIYVGGWALYKAELKKNLAKGMTQAEAKKKALETFERVTDETQQSGRMSQQSYWQSNPFLRAFTMFQSSQNQYFRKELNAVRGLVTGRMDGKQAAKTIFIYHFLLPMLFQYASDGFEWDKDAQLRTALIGSLNGVFVLNALLGKLYDAANTGSFTSGTMRVRDVIPFYGAIEDMSKFLVQLLNGEIEPDWSDYMDVLETFSKPLQTVGELAGLPVKYPLDVIKNFGSYAEDEEYGKETLLWLGWSPYALRDKE